MKKAGLYLLILIIPIFALSQSRLNNFLTPSDSLNSKRQSGILISESTAAAITLVGLNQLWYKDYDRSKFHTIDDFGEWMQVDKAGHIYSSYQLGRLGAEIQRWGGGDQKRQLLYGASLGFGYLSIVEIFDGFSKEWGFSWSDIAANGLGTGLYVGQDLLWNEQRILLKYSFHQTKYAEQRPERLGNGIMEEFIKDYNGQTYWVSANIKSLFSIKTFPEWINIALGYSAKGMLTGENQSINGMFIDQKRERQFFVSIDIDFNRISTKSPLLKTLFSLLNTLKVPFSAVEFTEENGVKLHAIYF